MPTEHVRRADFAHLQPLTLDVDGGKVQFVDYPAIAYGYAEAIVQGRDVACGLVIKACQRYLDMLEKAYEPGNSYYFSPSDVVDYCSFIENLRHIESGMWEIVDAGLPPEERGKIILEPWQIWIESAIHGFRRRRTGERLVSTALEVVPRKNAKAMALDTPIPTPGGWTTMGQLEIGDEVFAVDGTVTKVTDTSPVFVDHDCFLVKFSNGEEVVADAGHRWLTTARVDSPGRGAGNNTQNRTTRVRTTQEIFETQVYGARDDRNHSITMPAAIAGSHADLPIDPYVLGAWLGDGASNGPEIWAGSSDIEEMAGLLSGRGFVVDRRVQPGCDSLILRDHGHDRTMVNKARTKALADLGMVKNKHIPKEYLRASFHQRIALLQGLMDTDGTIDKGGKALSFTTSLPRIRDDMAELLATFGLKFSVIEAQDRIAGRDLSTVHWRISFCTFRDVVPAFRLDRKLARMRWSTDLKIAPRSASCQIISVERVASVPVKCIAVDHPAHLFLFGKTMLPTHNTLKMVGAALYELVGSGQMGAQIPIAASSARQSDETIYAALQKMVAREPELVEKFKIHATNEYISAGDGKIWSLTAKGEKHDGLNPSLAIFEEGHAGATSVYKVIKSAFGSRPNALIRMITTAGYRTEGPGYELLQEAKLILEGGHDDPTFFAAIYTLDLDDYIDKKTNAVVWDRLLNDEHLIFKANPMYGISLDPIKIATTVRGAMRKPAERAELARTRFDLWVGSGLSLIQQEQWDACRAKISIDDFVGQKCWLGVDLASTLDMCAITAIFELPHGGLAMFAKFFLPEESPTAQDEDIGDILHQWHEDGFLTLTPGPLADHDLVNAEIEDFCTVFDVQAIACDPKQAHNTVKYLWDGNRPVVLYANSADTMTGPTDDMIGKITAGVLMHDGNPVLAWNATNVHGERKPNGTILPRKDSPKSKRKIDGFVAGVMANGVRIMPQEAKPADGGKLKRSAYAASNPNLIGA